MTLESLNLLYTVFLLKIYRNYHIIIGRYNKTKYLAF